MLSRFILLVFLMSMVLSCKDGPAGSWMDKGVSQDLAQYRKKQVSDVIYHLNFSIPQNKKEAIPSRLKTELQVNNLDAPLVFDFNAPSANLSAIKVNGEEVNIKHQNEHIIIDRDDLKIGANEITIDFIAGEQSLNRNEEYLYTLLVPDRASTVFPCFDQPDIKAKYKLTITCPENWKVMSAAEVENVRSGLGNSTYIFEMSEQISSYLFSFIAGDFMELRKSPKSREMRMIYRENNEEKIAESTDPIFEIHQTSLDFLEDYTAQEFAFSKLDFACIPGFQYGGMEHVGAIQYRESALFLDKSATSNQKLSRAKLIAHETSHMWFGDLVTMKWFNDVWMKEVFANFMADKIMNPAYPEINHDLQFMMGHYPRAYSEDRTQGTNPIRQELPNLKNAGSLYGAIIYNKAPIMMRQLELLVGEDAFKKGVREYINKYASANADWPELIEILDAQSEIDLNLWSQVWVNESGRPIFSEHINIQNGIISSFEIEQKAEDGSTNIWPQKFNIALIYDDSIRVVAVDMNKTRVSLEDLKGSSIPKQIIYNYDGYGYGLFPSSQLHFPSLWQIDNEVARGYSFINSYEQLLNGNFLEPKKYLKLLIPALVNEENELILSYLTSITENIFWTFLNENERKEVQVELELELWNSIQSERKSNLKKELFGLYESIAFSDLGRNRLYDIWSKNEQVKGLNLNESDYTSIASSIAIYGDRRAEAVLAEMIDRISNPDRKERFTWLQASLSSDLAIRDAFMESLANVNQREKESWVAQALRNIHHPIRQKEALHHIPLVLDLLQEVQLTGDIFFPKRWLSSSIGRYSSSEANDLVNTFLEDRPEYSPVLKTKLLQSVDDLFRAQSIKLKG